MTLTQLRYLVAIADAELNITLAASRVHATQPGLSKQLKQLEDELGFLLFVRKGRSLESVTPAGTEVIARARAVLAEANNIRTYAANQRRESQGQLILTTTHTQARFVLPPAVAAIKQAYPQVSVHLQQAGEADALDRLNQGMPISRSSAPLAANRPMASRFPCSAGGGWWWCPRATRWTAPVAHRTWPRWRGSR